MGQASPSVNQETASFGQLRDMAVIQCKKLMNLIPSNTLPRLRNLQDLTVAGCPNVEFVVLKAADDSTLIIPQLRRLGIWNMKKLKSFYSSSTTSNAQSLFNHQYFALEVTFKKAGEKILSEFLIMAKLLVPCNKIQDSLDGDAFSLWQGMKENAFNLQVCLCFQLQSTVSH